MKTHVLSTFDERNFYITEDQATKAKLRWNEKKTIEFLDYPGEVIFPGTVASIGPKISARKTGFGPHMPLNSALEVFSLPSGSGGFWNEVIIKNNNRQGKPWVFAGAIELIKRHIGLKTVDEIFAYFYEHQQDYAQSNIPERKIDHEAVRMIQEFYKTEEGITYANYIKLFSR